MTNTETVSTERLADARVRFIGAKSRVDDEEMVEVPADYLDEGIAAFTELLASRTQEPAEQKRYLKDGPVLRLVRLRFFRDLIQSERVKVYEVFGIDKDDLPNPLTLGIEQQVFNQLFVRAASITPPAPERSKEDVPDRGKCAIAVQRWTILTGGDGFSGYYYAEGPGDLRIRTNDRALLDRILSALEPASLHEREDDGSDAAAIEIADAVIAWMVKYDLLDADLEYRDDDIIAVLDDLAPETAPLPVTIDDTSISARFNRLYGICRRILWADASTPAIGSEQTKAALADLAEFLFADGIDAALSKPGEQG